MHFTDFNMGHV